MQAANAATAKNGFSATGIVPLIRFVFTDKCFAPADVTDVLPDIDPIPGAPSCSREDDASAKVDTLECETGRSHRVNRSFEGENSSLLDGTADVLPGTESVPYTECSSGASAEFNAMDWVPGSPQSINSSFGSDGNKTIPMTLPCRVSDFKVSSSEVMSLPKTSTRKIVRGRRGKASNITASPYRNELKSLQTLKNIRKLKKAKKVEQKGFSNNGSETSKRGRPKGAKNQSKTTVMQDSLCEHCGSCFSLSEDGQDWLKCSKCFLWFHACQENARCPSCDFAKMQLPC
ncbi:uncharacterized protein LOC129779398 [Toxorhynchites rutilus septentrionalis]|uniref:uncharacterized protein LOC129779398 n=1 Tax=Toxorhynchites rutilus septentrionalis TaxID=329112 RepID=UPI00247916BF|nr:uncharacterized protein LOC129779398 [Toxorhynchites rutilus septentrionalis]